MIRYLALGLFGIMACLCGPMALGSTASYDEAVAQIIDILDLQHDTMWASVQAANLMISQNPSLKSDKKLYKQWSDKYLTWDAIRPEVVNAIKKAFNEPELREMITFYSTPTGKRVLQELPQLQITLLSLGSSQANSHRPELERMIRDQRKSTEDTHKQQEDH